MKKRILTLVLALLLALSLLPAGAMAVEEEEVEYTWDGFVCGTWEVDLQYQRELQVDKAKELLGVTAFVDQVEHYVNEQLTGIISYSYDENDRIAYRWTNVRVDDDLFAEANSMAFYYDEDGNLIDPYTKEVIGTYREFLDREFDFPYGENVENISDEDGKLLESRYTDSEGNAIRDVYIYREPITEDEQIPEPPGPVVFPDVGNPDLYYYEAVKWALMNEVTTGIDGDHFGPNLDCTRAQMVTFLWRAVGSPAPKKAANPFSDVKEGAYFYDAVLWAVEEGVTQGTGAGKFSPNATVTRGQTVTFLYRFCEEPEVSERGSGFDDVSAKAYYAIPVAWALENEITNGVGHNRFQPNDPCTRAQIVTFLYRAMA